MKKDDISGAAEGGFRPRRKISFGFSSKGGSAKNLYTKSEILTFSYRVTWNGSEGANLYNRQIMIVPRNPKTFPI
jgi:hypothetical protein